MQFYNYIFEEINSMYETPARLYGQSCGGFYWRNGVRTGRGFGPWAGQAFQANSISQEPPHE